MSEFKYCPKCRGEYLPHISHCTKCDCDLVESSEIQPFCPSCGKIYTSGEYYCPNCHAAIHIVSPSEDGYIKPMPLELAEYTDWVTVHEAANEAELAIVKGALESNEVKFIAKGENLQHIEGLGTVIGFNPLFGPVQIQVPPEIEKQAIKIIKEILE